MTEALAGHGAPSVRVGMDYGAAVERERDWFGTVVNVAARVTAAATGGEVLLTDRVHAAAGVLPGISFARRGRRTLRNVAEPVDLWAATRLGGDPKTELVVDPVCRMAVDPAHAAGTLRHEGRTYHFCSFRCVEAFVSQPGRYA